MTILKSLAEHEAEGREFYERMKRAREPHPNGIACPQCGAELWDGSPGISLLTDPTKKKIHCPACGWGGYTTSTDLVYVTVPGEIKDE